MRTFISAAVLSAILAPMPRAAGTPYLDAALEAARWIRASATETEQGTMWPADPRDKKSVNDTLYAGTPGVILFFIEASRSTGDLSLMKNARAGADHLLATFPNEKD